MVRNEVKPQGPPVFELTPGGHLYLSRGTLFGVWFLYIGPSTAGSGHKGVNILGSGLTHCKALHVAGVTGLVYSVVSEGP